MLAITVRMRRFVAALLVPASLGLIAAVPAHVQTSDYFGGYAGTRRVAPATAARWLTWAETNIADSKIMRALGVKTLLYTDPNRTIEGGTDPDYTADYSAFARDCSGARITTGRKNQYLMDPHSAALFQNWKKHVDRYVRAGNFSAVFSDDANNVKYVKGLPCHYDPADWLAATNAMQRSLGFPVVYNGLSNYSDDSVSASIGLNDTAIGGVMEQCYATSPKQPKASGSRWTVAENTELRMAAAHKYFFCYGNDTSAADQSLDARLYVYASFLLTYDPATSVLWEYYAGPLQFHVMPEVQLVALDPRGAATSIGDLRTASGTYLREYGACYLAGRNEGPCAVAVNPDDAAHPLRLNGYARTLTIAGGGILDGGTVRVATTKPPSQLEALSAAIAFK